MAFIQGPVFENTYELQYFGGEALYGFAVLFLCTASSGSETTIHSTSEGLGTSNRTTLKQEVVHLKMSLI